LAHATSSIAGATVGVAAHEEVVLTRGLKGEARVMMPRMSALRATVLFLGEWNGPNDSPDRARRALNSSQPISSTRLSRSNVSTSPSATSHDRRGQDTAPRPNRSGEAYAIRLKVLALSQARFVAKRCIGRHVGRPFKDEEAPLPS
jgi:hypothetical protein